MKILESKLNKIAKNTLPLLVAVMGIFLYTQTAKAVSVNHTESGNNTEVTVTFESDVLGEIFGSGAECASYFPDVNGNCYWTINLMGTGETNMYLHVSSGYATTLLNQVYSFNNLDPNTYEIFLCTFDGTFPQTDDNTQCNNGYGSITIYEGGQSTEGLEVLYSNTPVDTCNPSSSLGDCQYYGQQGATAQNYFGATHELNTTKSGKITAITVRLAKATTDNYSCNLRGAIWDNTHSNSRQYVSTNTIPYSSLSYNTWNNFTFFFDVNNTLDLDLQIFDGFSIGDFGYTGACFTSSAYTQVLASNSDVGNQQYVYGYQDRDFYEIIYGEQQTYENNFINPVNDGVYEARDNFIYTGQCKTVGEKLTIANFLDLKGLPESIYDITCESDNTWSWTGTLGVGKFTRYIVSECWMQTLNPECKGQVSYEGVLDLSSITNFLNIEYPIDETGYNYFHVQPDSAFPVKISYKVDKQQGRDINNYSVIRYTCTDLTYKNCTTTYGMQNLDEIDPDKLGNFLSEEDISDNEIIHRKIELYWDVDNGATPLFTLMYTVEGDINSVNPPQVPGSTDWGKYNWLKNLIVPRDGFITSRIEIIKDAFFDRVPFIYLAKAQNEVNAYQQETSTDPKYLLNVRIKLDGAGFDQQLTALDVNDPKFKQTWELPYQTMQYVLWLYLLYYLVNKVLSIWSNDVIGRHM